MFGSNCETPSPKPYNNLVRDEVLCLPNSPSTTSRVFSDDQSATTPGRRQCTSRTFQSVSNRQRPRTDTCGSAPPPAPPTRSAHHPNKPKSLRCASWWPAGVLTPAPSGRSGWMWTAPGGPKVRRVRENGSPPPPSGFRVQPLSQTAPLQHGRRAGH
jgi:hypothetical protein